MKIRGSKSPVPKKMPATNSGIFSNSGKGQKMDPVKRSPIVEATIKEAMSATGRKSIAKG